MQKDIFRVKNFALFVNVGSGFKSMNSYKSGYFGVAMKLQPGYTAGVITCFYVSNNQIPTF